MLGALLTLSAGERHADLLALELGALDRHEVQLVAEAAAADQQERRLARALVGVEILGAMPSVLAVDVDHLALAHDVQIGCSGHVETSS